MLAQLLLAWLQIMEEIAPTDGSGDRRPHCPEILHPAQSTAVQQHARLCPSCEGNRRHYWLKHDPTSP